MKPLLHPLELLLQVLLVSVVLIVLKYLHVFLLGEEPLHALRLSRVCTLISDPYLKLLAIRHILPVFELLNELHLSVVDSVHWAILHLTINIDLPRNCHGPTEAANRSIHGYRGELMVT